MHMSELITILLGKPFQPPDPGSHVAGAEEGALIEDGNGFVVSSFACEEDADAVGRIYVVFNWTSSKMSYSSSYSDSP